ncbi:glycoside hydrolase family 24 protein [Kamptonema formosum]|uniref:glycoside hydrolase family 24 protein n=1 Tax=Kamptonema formosum TaxID=331992 RepID=UPI00034C7332|nr:glycoside hydrolase family 104 protein [Oscillatoria sp. PCC 10802]
MRIAQQPLTSSSAGGSDTELIHKWLQQKPPARRRSHWLLVKQFRDFVRKPLTEVTKADVDAFATSLTSRGIPPQTVARTVLAVKSLLAFGAKRTGTRPVNTPPPESRTGARQVNTPPPESRTGTRPVNTPPPESHTGARQVNTPPPELPAAPPPRRKKPPASEKYRPPLRLWLSLGICFGLLLTVSRAGMLAPASREISKKWEEILSPPPDESVKNARTKAFLDTIAWAEGTDEAARYRTQYTGTQFAGFHDHPREIKCGVRYGQQLCADAAGRYLFLSSTWDRLAKKIGATDFSPANQDLAAIELLREHGALEDIEAGRFEVAVHKLTAVWPSLKHAGDGHNEPAIVRLHQVYQKRLESYL